MPISQQELDAMNAEADNKITLEMVESGLTQDQWEQRERSKYRWSGSITRGMLISASDLAGDMNTGILSLLGPEVQDILVGFALKGGIQIGRFSNEPPRMGITGAGAESAGQTMTLAGGLAGMLGKGATRVGFKLMANDASPSISGRIGRDLLGTLDKRGASFGELREAGSSVVGAGVKRLLNIPGATTAELAGGLGAGMAAEGVEQSGGGPVQQGIAGLAGGFAAGAVPVWGANFTRQAMNWSLRHISPWIDGGEVLAATRLQRLAVGPPPTKKVPTQEAAKIRSAQETRLANLAEKVRKAPTGVSPARATEDQNLMALEARIAEDNPVIAAEFQQSLDDARRIAQQELRDFAGDMRQPGEWERAVIEVVAAPGAVIKLSDPVTMLKQAAKSFRPMYEDFSGYPVKPEIDTGAGIVDLQQAFKISVVDETVLASTAERKAAQVILKDELSRIRPSSLEAQPTIDSKNILIVRQNLREKISQLTASRNRASHITARILSNAEGTLTNMLQQQLPDEAMGVLSQIDDNYNLYRVVEQAVTAAGGRKLSGEALGQAIRQLAPNDAGPLKAMARVGRDVESVLGDPRATSLMVKGQKPTVRKQIQGDFFDSLWRRSMSKELADDATPFVSGDRFLNNLVSHKADAKALGIDDATLNRAMDIARTIRAMEAQSPAALRNTIEEGPATMLQLFATLVGAKSGQRLAGAGIGSSLVMSQFASSRARRWFSTFFRDDATDLLIKAAKNKDLYAALLTKSTASIKEQEAAARVIAAWLEPVTEQAFEDQDE